MRKQTVILQVGITIPLLFVFLFSNGQPGTDRDGGFFLQYTNLWDNTSGFFNRRSGALGVYDQATEPNSILEVNSLNSHLTTPYSTVANRGELLRTTAPNNVTANWRFFHGAGNQVGRFYSESGNDHIQLLSRAADMIFRSNNGTSDGRERMRVFDQNFSPSPGMVRIADPEWMDGSNWYNSTNGPGGFPNEQPRLLVVGGTDAVNQGNMTEIAQF